MPPEILAEIFSWTLPSPTSEMVGSVADLGLSPWVVSRVSSRWRATALATPLLWSTIFVCFGKANPPSLDMVKAQMDRSRSLKIHFFGSEEGDSAPQIELFLFLSQQSDRWEDLSIQLTSDLAPHLTAIRGCLSSLRRLWMQWDDAESDFTANSIECFEAAPSLAEAGWLNESHDISMLLPAHQLTVYQANGPWEDHQSVLKSAHHLVEARIVVQFPSWQSGGAGSAVIDLPHLRRLYVGNAEILDHLRAPSLAELAIHIRVRPNPSMLEHLGPFFDRSPCAPHRLCLSGALHTSVTETILRKYTFISGIRLVAKYPPSLDEDTIRTAVAAHLNLLTVGDTSVSPHLDEISFGSETELPINFPLLLNMLISRRSPLGALKTAAFLSKSGPMPGIQTLAGLEALRAGGLRLSVGQGREAGIGVEGWTYGPTWN
ncbi:hypothetical protein FB45DRAFT_922040 [Roridomyces roridus]|uniref:F-box domain-containing protein n=1 Tax=Roridomyces roridus TaxID=1738132 RepID=A0AAD7BMS3_9AGAR|nr:hypothetical protein FB45DRAFT_922040 [Roridomyces roridus]